MIALQCIGEEFLCQRLVGGQRNLLAAKAEGFLGFTRFGEVLREALALLLAAGIAALAGLESRVLRRFAISNLIVIGSGVRAISPMHTKGDIVATLRP